MHPALLLHPREDYKGRPRDGGHHGVVGDILVSRWYPPAWGGEGILGRGCPLNSPIIARDGREIDRAIVTLRERGNRRRGILGIRDGRGGAYCWDDVRCPHDSPIVIRDGQEIERAIITLRREKTLWIRGMDSLKEQIQNALGGWTPLDDRYLQWVSQTPIWLTCDIDVIVSQPLAPFWVDIELSESHKVNVRWKISRTAVHRNIIPPPNTGFIPPQKYKTYFPWLKKGDLLNWQKKSTRAESVLKWLIFKIIF